MLFLLRNSSIALLLLSSIAFAQNIDPVPSSGSGSSTITANSTGTSGFSAGQVLYSDGTLIQAIPYLIYESSTGTIMLDPPIPGGSSTSGGFILNFTGVAYSSLPSVSHFASYVVYGGDASHATGYYAFTYGGTRSINVGYSIGGTAASPTATQSGQEMYRVTGRGYDSDYTGSTSDISFIAGQTFSTGNNGAWVGFRTTALNTAAGSTASTPPIKAGVTPAGGMFIGPCNATYSGQNITTLTTDPGVGALLFCGSTSGTLIFKSAAVAGTNTITWPAGTTDFSSTGGTSQVVKQTSSGGALTVAALLAADLPASTVSTQGATVSGCAAYTPTDQSGASLTFTSPSGEYCITGPTGSQIVTVFFSVTYPTTADASAAKISVPVAVPNQAYAVVKGTPGISSTSVNVTPRTVINSSTIAFTPAATNVSTLNSVLTASTLSGTIQYPVQ